ncbi:MAG: hypothetical protein ACREMA_03715 [Longimicrobiales bacterium]
MQKLAPDDPRPRTPGVTPGDEFWMENFGATRVAYAYKEDLRDVVARTLAELTPPVTLAQLRAGGRSTALLSVRDVVVERALQAGHRPFRIARFLNLSDSTISRVKATLAQRA